MSGTGFTHLLALYWLIVFIHETHVMPSSGKVKTKRHLFSYLVISVSECCPICQLLQTRTNYHITYILLLQIAFILWHYIDWWCLFMKHIWCLLVAKQKLKGIYCHIWLFQVVLIKVLVAPNRNKLPHYVHFAGTFCTHLVALYWLMVFIHETHVMPSSGKVKTKSHLSSVSYLVLAGSECCPMSQLLQTGTN